MDKTVKAKFKLKFQRRQNEFNFPFSHELRRNVFVIDVPKEEKEDSLLFAYN